MMLVSMVEAEQNGRLLCALKEQFKARDFGAIGGFFVVPARWRCPCCHRSKPEIARLDKNENLLCSVVEHHDHFDESVAKHIDLRTLAPDDVTIQRTVEESLIRFPPTQICSDCNVAEPAAKQIVGAPSAFSFAPCEIAAFITVAINVPHQIDAARVRAAFESARPSMELLAARLRAIKKSTIAAGDWELMAQPAMRVLATVKAKARKT